MTAADPRRFLYRERSTPTRPSAWRPGISRSCDDGELYLQYRRQRGVRLRRRPAEDRRLSIPRRASACAASPARPPPSPTPTRSARRRSTAPRRPCKLLDPAKGRPAPPAAPHQPGDVRRRRSAVAPIPFAEKVALCQKIDAAARARDPAGRAGQRRPRRQLERDRDRSRRRLRRHRRPAAGPAQRADRRPGRRPARDRLPRARRALSLRPAVRAGRVEPGDRHRAGPGAGESRIRSPLRPARCRSCSAPAGRACCSTKRSATGSKATSTARAPRLFPAASASASPRPG